MSSVVLPSAASASVTPDEVSWSVQPSSGGGVADSRDSFQYDLAPGRSVDDYVAISNRGTEPLTVDVYAMDAVMTSEGAFSLPPAGTESTGVGSWVRMTGDGRHTIEPGTRVEIPFRLVIPPTADPGDHAGGIVASVREEGSSTGEQQVAVDRRVGARIYVSLPGDREPALRVSDVAPAYGGGAAQLSGPTDVSFRVTNEGNIRLAGSAHVRLSAPFGIPLGDPVTVALPEMLPGGTVDLRAAFEGIPAAVLLTASVTLEPTLPDGAFVEAGGTLEASGVGWAVPWISLAVVAALIAFVVWFWMRSRRLKRRLAAAEAQIAQSAEPTLVPSR